MSSRARLTHKHFTGQLHLTAAANLGVARRDLKIKASRAAAFQELAGVYRRHPASVSARRTTNEHTLELARTTASQMHTSSTATESQLVLHAQRHRRCCSVMAMAHAALAR
jgi:hypothetical protein